MAEVIDEFVFTELDRCGKDTGYFSEYVTLFIIQTESTLSVLIQQQKPALVINYFTLPKLYNKSLHNRTDQFEYKCELCRQTSSYTVFVGRSTDELLTVEQEIGPITEQPNRTVFCADCYALLHKEIVQWVSSHPQEIVATQI